MPPRKRPAAKAPKSKAIRPNKRANRARVQPEVPVVPAGLDTSNERAPTDETRPSQGTVSVDVGAITSTISAVISQAIKTAFSADNLATILGTNANQQVVSQDTARPVDKAVDADVADLTLDMNSQSGTGGVNPINLVNTGLNDPKPQTPFTSVSVALTSRVSPKIKAKIWANEYIDFGTLLSSSPQNEGKYSLSMSPSVGSSNKPQLTLEPCHVSKRIHNISQWVSAFTTFVSVYAERFTNQTPQLMKYCDVVRDLALKAADWLWYDEQFRYLRQSAPDQFPWDQIHWELWLRASNTFRKTQPQPPTNKPLFRSQFFPKGTCWAFQAGKHCSGCQFEHLCFKCRGKHPGGQCSAPSTKTRFAPGFKGRRDGTQVLGSAQQASHASKSGSA